MVDAVDGNPTSRRVFEAADPQYGKRMFNPSGSFEASVRKQSVVTDRDSLSENVNPDKHGDEADPREEIGDQCHESEEMDNQNSPEVEPIDRIGLYGLGDGNRHLGHTPLQKGWFRSYGLCSNRTQPLVPLFEKRRFYARRQSRYPYSRLVPNNSAVNKFHRVAPANSILGLIQYSGG